MIEKEVEGKWSEHENDTRKREETSKKRSSVKRKEIG